MAAETTRRRHPVRRTLLVLLGIAVLVGVALVLLEVLRATRWRPLRRAVQQGVAWSGLFALGAIASVSLVAGMAALVAG